MTRRKTAPFDRTKHGLPLAFRVWCEDKDGPHSIYADRPWHCAAAFRFLLEALDYIAYCQDAGVDVVFQSPADCKVIRADDRRVVAA